jgi:uncharacterized C2H2 Zn-finger protein
MNIPKIPKLFCCEKCNYTCSNKKDYNKHILTAKHKYRTTFENIEQKNPKQTFVCECGKQYNARNSLWYHKQRCIPIVAIEPELPPVATETASIIELLKQNNEFKSLMVDQYTHLQESNQKNQELQQQLVDAVKNNTGSITNHNNTTNHNNNQRFNINVFLNDTCKDAMSITDFLQNIDVQNDELEYIGHHGYVNGMTKMIMDRLKNMDVTKRPIHCTDIKRETMYIKEDGGWCKDTEELSKLRKILSRISMNNYRSVPNWRNSHPECEVVASRTYDFCYKMMQAILGNVEDEQIRLDNKIIKTMAKTLFVNKITA